MRTKSFTYNGATITVRRGTVRDRLAVDALVWELPDTTSLAESHAQRSFGRAVVQTVSVEGELGFSWPNVSATADVLKAGFEALMDADGALWDAWKMALHEVDGELTDPKLVEGNTNPKKEATPGA